MQFNNHRSLFLTEVVKLKFPSATTDQVDLRINRWLTVAKQQRKAIVAVAKQQRKAIVA